jgi:ABC-2 type transport system ATP-binding protein
MTTLQIDHLTKRYRDTVAVDDLSFDVRPGTVTGFLGPNGAGKSTTMRMLLGLTRPTSGTALIGGKRYDELDDPTGTVGAMLEMDAFHPGRSGRNHLRALAAASRVPRSRVDTVLDTVGLADAADRRVGGYSLGMRQRLGLGAAMLGEPGVLVLDEPANGLDPQGMRWLRDLLRWEASRGATVFVSSHVLSELALFADEVVVIDRGRLITQAPVADLTSGTVSETTVAAADPGALAEVLRQRGATVEPLGDARMVVRDLDAPTIGAVAFEAGIVLHELAPRSTTLEDVFLDLTGATA